MEKDNPNKTFKHTGKPAAPGESLLEMAMKLSRQYEEQLEQYREKSRELKLKEIELNERIKSNKAQVKIETTKNSLAEFYNNAQHVADSINSKYHNKIEDEVRTEKFGLVWNCKYSKWEPAKFDETGRPLEPNYNEDEHDR